MTFQYNEVSYNKKFEGAFVYIKKIVNLKCYNKYCLLLFCIKFITKNALLPISILMNKFYFSSKVYGEGFCNFTYSD